MEILKLLQTFMIQSDKYMVYEGQTAICKTADLIEELGQVEFVFSDKTGTLTRNEMVFKFCAINRKVYGKMQEENTKSTSFMSEKPLLDKDFNINGDTEASFIVKMKGAEASFIENFFRLLCVCHSCVTEKDNNGNLSYASSSPDELALVKGAVDMGFVFTERSSKFITFENRYFDSSSNSYTEKWEFLAEIPFDSDRKRMSVIVKNIITGEIYIFCKGADNIMLPRCQMIKEEKEFCESKKIIYEYCLALLYYACILPFIILIINFISHLYFFIYSLINYIYI